MRIRTEKIRFFALFCAAWLLLCALGGCAGGAQKAAESTQDLPVIRVGSDNYPPYNYDDANGQPTGIDVDLAKEAFRRMGYQATFVTIDWEEKKEQCFQGQWLVCDFGKELSGEVRLSENAKKLRRQHRSDSVEMENPAFNDRFLVTAASAQEAYYLLTPHMMEYILSAAGRSGGEVYMAFLRGGKLHIAVQTGRDFFELGKSAANIERLRQKFLGELRWFTGILDELRLADTLYRKATDKE